MGDRQRDSLTLCLRLGPRCYRCGALLDVGGQDVCPGCTAESPTLWECLLCLRQFQLGVLLIVVAIVAFASALAVHEPGRRLAEDRGGFSPLKERANPFTAEVAAALALAEQAERKALEGGPDAPRWAQKAAEMRARAAAASEAKREYDTRATVKRARSSPTAGTIAGRRIPSS